MINRLRSIFPREKIDVPKPAYIAGQLPGRWHFRRDCDYQLREVDCKQAKGWMYHYLMVTLEVFAVVFMGLAEIFMVLLKWFADAFLLLAPPAMRMVSVIAVAIAIGVAGVAIGMGMALDTDVPGLIVFLEEAFSRTEDTLLILPECETGDVYRITAEGWECVP